MDPHLAETTLVLCADDVKSYYEQLVSLYRHSLTTFVARRLGNPADAEDIVQEVFLRAYLALETYEPSRRATLKARPWLYKITWNLCSSYLGRTTPKLARHTPLDSAAESEAESSAEPETAFERVERREELLSLISALPPHYSTVVNLYYFAELSYAEIADVLGQPIGTVKVYVHRGIRLLRKALLPTATG